MKLFGTDGIRDAFGGEKMNQEIAKAFGKAIVSFCRKRNLPARVVVGRDPRESGPSLEEAVVSGITSVGGDAIVAGVLPTPAVAWLVSEQRSGMGIVISASHNLFEDNGLKPFKSDGTKLSKEEEKEIEGYIFDNNTSETGENNFSEGKKIILPEAKEKYVKFVLDKAKLWGISRREVEKGKSLALALDCANGATYETAPAIFKKIAEEITVICANPDGKNINENCGSQHPKNLQEEVKGKKADLGLAFDGDGDRVIAVDEKERVLTGDQMIYVIAKMLKEKGKLKKDLVVTTVMSNLGFVDALKNLGISHIATAVGDRQVFFEMKKRGAVLGGEESGHIIYTDFYPTGDGIVGGLLLLEAMEYFQKSLSELAGEITLFPKLLVNVEVKSKPELDKIGEIRDIIRKVENKLGSEGRVLVRYSGTENLCRVMVEGRSEKEIRGYANRIAGVIKKCLS